MENLERLKRACRSFLAEAETTDEITNNMLNNIIIIKNEATAIVEEKTSLPKASELIDYMPE